MDPQWEVPHYEKMLYDNAQLIRLFARATRVLGPEPFARLTRDVGDYLLDRLLDAEGEALMSSEDADTEGVEGKTYVWTEEETRAVLSQAGLDPAPFLEGHRFHHEGTLIRVGPFRPELRAHREALLEVRDRRPQPGIDTKVVTAWNGMAVSGLALAGTILGEQRYIEAARSIANVLLGAMDQRGRLPRHLGPESPEGVLADHAQLCEGLLDLYEADPQPRWLLAADRLANRIRERFGGSESGGLYEAAPSAEALLFRRQSWGSGAQPDAAAVSGRAFLRLAAYGAPSVEQTQVEALLKAAGKTLETVPGSSPTLSRLLQDLVEPSRELIVAGDAGDPRTQALLDRGRETERPGLVLGLVPSEATEGGAGLENWAAFKGRSPAEDGSPRAYLCTERVCKMPVSDPEALAKLLDGGARDKEPAD